MKTPSKYPVLENRPIDQWKVTELREELKRRKLITKGLKEELVRRLDEALRSESDATEEEVNGIDEPETDTAIDVAETEGTISEAGESVILAPENAEEPVGDQVQVGADLVQLDADPVQLDADSVQLDAEPVQVDDLPVQVDADPVQVDADPVQVDADPTQVDALPVQVDALPVQVDALPVQVDALPVQVDALSVQVGIEDSAEHPSQEKSLEEIELKLVSSHPPGEGLLAATDLPSTGEKVCDSLSFETTMGGVGLQDVKMERDNEDSREQQDSDDIKPPHEDVKLDSSDSNNQVSEVNTSLGFPVKSNSISTDSVSINEKNELKDNIIADNVKLEPDVKPEMVRPSSSDLVPDGGESHPRDVEEPHENKVSVEETDNNVTNADMSEKNYSADLGSEKLNLDRSSGDDSMEEDAPESKQFDSNYNSEEAGVVNEKIEVTTMKEEKLVVTMVTESPAEEKYTHVENKGDVAASSDKRKLPDQETILNNEPPKRQRRWKSENNKVGEPQTSNIRPLAAAKDVPQSASVKHNFSVSNSVGDNGTPKEREVPPSTKAATNSLRIDRFLRPFTLKAVQELLGKTGTVTSFWMDHIKTHCYVTYSSVEEALETRNAVYNLQWPPNGGRHLMAEFVDPQEVKLRLEAPAQLPPPPAPPAPEPAPMMPQPSPRQQNRRQVMPQPPPTLPPPPPLSNQTPARDPPVHLPPPPVDEKMEAPIVTLDDLFRKTKATPRIYYLPLSEEQVEARRKNSRQ